MAGLRPAEIEPSLRLIRGLQARGITIVVVEHVMKAIVAAGGAIAARTSAASSNCSPYWASG